MPEQLGYTQRNNILAGRVIFSDYVQRRSLINQARLIGLNLNLPDNDVSMVPVLKGGEVNTTAAELATYLAQVAPASSQSSATVPGPPLSLCVIPSDSSLTIIFLQGSDGGSAITDYQYSTDGVTYTNLGQTISPLTISGLTNGTSYTIYLKAVNAVGASIASDTITAVPIPSSFDPSNISGLNVWLDAQNIANVILAGGQVSAWNDSSSATNDFTASAAGIITYDQPSNINGRPALNFTTSAPTTSTYLSKTFNITPGTNELTLFMIVNQTGTGSGNSELFFTIAAPTSPAFRYFDLFNNTNPSQNGLLTLNIGSITQNDTGIDIITTPSTIAIISVVISTTGNVYVNGNTTPVSGATRGGLSLDNASLEWAISGQAFLGNIGEVITYPTALADSDRQKVEGYLAWKWGLQANLPGSNPWKTTPPTGDTAPGAPTLTYILGADASAYVYYTAGTGTPINYQYTTDNGTSFTSSSPLDIVAPSLVPSLTNGSSSTVKLRAYNGGGYSVISNGLSVTPATASAPTGWLVIDPTTYSGSGAVISGGSYTPTLSGTIAGSVTWITGTGISTKVFNFTGGRIGFPSFNFGDTFTISAWVYPSDKYSINAIIANGSPRTGPPTPGFKFCWNSWNSTNKVLFFENGDNTTQWGSAYTVTDTVTMNEWQQLTVIFDRTNSIAVFLKNGLPVSVGYISTSSNVVVTGVFNIGAFIGGSYSMNAQLGLLKVFNTCLTGSEVLADFNATKSAFGL